MFIGLFMSLFSYFWSIGYRSLYRNQTHSGIMYFIVLVQSCSSMPLSSLYSRDELSAKIGINILRLVQVVVSLNEHTTIKNPTSFYISNTTTHFKVYGTTHNIIIVRQKCFGKLIPISLCTKLGSSNFVTAICKRSWNYLHTDFLATQKEIKQSPVSFEKSTHSKLYLPEPSFSSTLIFCIIVYLFCSSLLYFTNLK